MIWAKSGIKLILKCFNMKVQKSWFGLFHVSCILLSLMLLPVIQEAGLQSSRECSHRGGGSGSGGSAESGLSSIHHHRLNCSSHMSSDL